jgi:membrane-associated phospholipid phosphatase
MQKPSGNLFLHRFILSLVYLLTVPVLYAQTIQSYASKDSMAVYPPGCYQKFKVTKFIGPAALITYGYVATKSDALFNISKSVQQYVWVDHPHNTTTIDNYLQFAPAVAVYALDLAGIKGEHNFVDRSMIYLISNVIMGGFVYTIKNASHELRPNGNDYQSFPSGHTAEAFLSATFLFEEYKNVSVWYGVGGYLVAGFVGYLRVYNNAHWLHDVVAGAGFGIASTELTYWLYPLLKRTFFPKSCGNKMIVPVMEDHGVGLAFIQRF